MKCPLCGAWSTVLQTRVSPEGLTRRRRECANHHRFNSHEISAMMFSGSQVRIGDAMEAQRKRWARWERDQRIVKDPRIASVVAQEYGIHKSQVIRVRRAARLGVPESDGEE